MCVCVCVFVSYVCQQTFITVFNGSIKLSLPVCLTYVSINPRNKCNPSATSHPPPPVLPHIHEASHSALTAAKQMLAWKSLTCMEQNVKTRVQRPVFFFFFPFFFLFRPFFLFVPFCPWVLFFVFFFLVSAFYFVLFYLIVFRPFLFFSSFFFFSLFRLFFFFSNPQLPHVPTHDSLLFQLYMMVCNRF